MSVRGLSTDAPGFADSTGFVCSRGLATSFRQGNEAAQAFIPTCEALPAARSQLSMVHYANDLYAFGGDVGAEIVAVEPGHHCELVGVHVDTGTSRTTTYARRGAGRGAGQ